MIIIIIIIITTTTTTIIIIVVFQGLGLLACSDSELIFSEIYGSIYTVGRTPWTGNRPDARPLHKQDNTNTEKRGQTSMPRGGFEPTIQVFERPKTVRQPTNSLNRGQLFKWSRNFSLTWNAKFHQGQSHWIVC